MQVCKSETQTRHRSGFLRRISVYEINKENDGTFLAVLALGGCTQSSISSNAPDMVEGVDPAKMNQEEDETLPREENILLENEDEKEPETMYEWEQVTDEA